MINYTEEMKQRLINTFVEGAKWWMFNQNGFTAFPSEVDEMEKEAERRIKNGTLGETFTEKMERLEKIK